MITRYNQLILTHFSISALSFYNKDWFLLLFKAHPLYHCVVLFDHIGK